ncbi:hypothetical protein ABZ807_15770 [Micromonospora sp. NPDC047548]|uniref:hypothetical protein n=1 Tax=Micromonospora sp. NPDC047548 TaxID=3155624 RepID=UPI0033F2640D
MPAILPRPRRRAERRPGTRRTSGRGVIAGRQVRCEAPGWAVRWHTGYPPRAVDRHDVPLLCGRFAIDLAEGFA